MIHFSQVQKSHFGVMDSQRNKEEKDYIVIGSPALAKKKRDNISTALVDAATVVAKAFQTSPTVTTDGSPVRGSMPTGHLQPPSKLSPFKYAQLRRSCLEDLKSIKDLYQDNVVSEAELTEEKARILSTLKTLQCRNQ